MSEEQKDIQAKPVETNETSSYRSIFKATSLFGGVQIWKILITIVQTKFVAVILGPAGMGLKGLYSSATSLIQSLTAMGLSSSAVRDVSQAHGTGDSKRIGYVVSVLRKLVWFTGLLGMTLVITLSPVLSKTTFGNNDYIIPFIILSVTLLLAQLTVGQNVLLQGTRRLTYLAKAGIIGSIVSLVVTVPLYYFFGTKGVIPAMVLESLSLFLLAYHFARKVKVEKCEVGVKEALREGKGMVALGLVMTYNSMLVLGASYIIRVFITRIGGIADVGLYSAGFAVVNTYVAMVFSAMDTDYYPRLAAVNQDNVKCTTTVNQQMEVALLIIGPLMLLFLPLAPLAIIAIYSSKFLPIIGYMQWASLGIVFKALGWAISYQFIAKGDKKVFAINETVANIIGLVFDISGYYFWGITGLGISFFVRKVVYFFMVYAVSHKKYGYNLSAEVIKITLTVLVCLVVVFLMLQIWSQWWIYFPTGIIIIVTCWYAFVELDKRMGIKQAITNIIKRKK